jgi:ribosomal protein L11 methyltransferase
MKKYKEFTISADPFNTEVLSSILWELEIKGINEEENCLRVFADEESDLSTILISRQMIKLQTEKLISSFTVEESILEDKNWNEEWEKSLNVIRVTDKIVIRPSYRNYEKKKDEIIITIDPRMAFGTGEHQTTKLMIMFLEKYIQPGMKVLDAGTGTGILSIAAVKLGAVNAIGFDTDEWCFENAKENCKINGVAEKIEIRQGDTGVIKENDFDLILANIQKNILTEFSGEFLRRINKGGIIILSGILKDDESDIIKAYSQEDVEYKETLQMDEWIVMAFVKY